MTDAAIPIPQGISEEQLDAMAEAVAEQMLAGGVVEAEEAEPTAGVRFFVFMRTLPRRTRRGLVRGTGHGIHLGRKVRAKLVPHLSFREVMAVLTQLAFSAAAAALVFSLGTWAFTVAPVLGVGMLLAVGAYIALRAWALLMLNSTLDDLAKAVVPQ